MFASILLPSFHHQGQKQLRQVGPKEGWKAQEKEGWGATRGVQRELGCGRFYVVGSRSWTFGFLFSGIVFENRFLGFFLFSVVAARSVCCARQSVLSLFRFTVHFCVLIIKLFAPFLSLLINNRNIMLHLLVFFFGPFFVSVAWFLIKPATRFVACYLMFSIVIYIQDLLCHHAVFGDFVSYCLVYIDCIHLSSVFAWFVSCAQKHKQLAPRFGFANTWLKNVSNRVCCVPQTWLAQAKKGWTT